MKIDLSKVKKTYSDVPADCGWLIEKLGSCSNDELLEVLRTFNTWAYGKCELYHWTAVLDRFDGILEQASAKHVPPHCVREQHVTWVLECDLPENVQLEELVVWVLNFTTLLVEHSFSRHLYSSVDRLVALLSSSSLNIVLAVLNLLYMFSKRSNFLTRLGQPREALLTRLIHLAESWGGKENGFDLAHCCKPLPLSSYPESATSMHFEAQLNSEAGNTPKTSSCPMPVLIPCVHLMARDKTPSQIMDDILAQYKIPQDRQMAVFTHLRLACNFALYETRLQCVEARLQALSVLVYCNALQENANTILYSGLLDEFVAVLELKDLKLTEIKAATLRTLTSIIHLERMPNFPKLSTIMDVTGASSYHGFLPLLVRSCITSLTSDQDANHFTNEDTPSTCIEASDTLELGKTPEPLFPPPLATALFSFLYHLASYESGGEALVACGMMESLLSVVNWRTTVPDNITFVTRAVRVIDLITNLDLHAFQAHGGINAFINRLELEVNECRKEQPFVINPPNASDRGRSNSPLPMDTDTAGEVAHSGASTSSVSPPDASLLNLEDRDEPSAEAANTSFTEVSPSTEPWSVPCLFRPVSDAMTEDDSGSERRDVKGRTTVTTPDYSASKTSLTCLAQRAALLKSMLNFLKKAIQDMSFGDSMRHMMETSLPSSLRHIISNAEYYGPSLFLLATEVVTAYVFGEPSFLSSLQDNGLTDVILHALLIKEAPATREVLSALPHVFTALCLNNRGLNAFGACKPFERLFKVLLIPDYLPAMRRRRSSDALGDTASNLGTATDELLRHQPSLKSEAMKAIVVLLREVCNMGRDAQYVCWKSALKHEPSPTPSVRALEQETNDNSSDEDEYEEEDREVVGDPQSPSNTSAHQDEPPRSGVGVPSASSDITATGPSLQMSTTIDSTKKPVPLVDYILNVMKFLEAILSTNATDDHCKEFVQQQGLGPLLEILGLANLPIDFPSSQACQAVSAVCKSILNLSHESSVIKTALECVDEQLGNLNAIIENKSTESILLQELHEALASMGGSQSLNTPSDPILNPRLTPTLHSLTSLHAYTVMLVHVCRTSQADIRQVSTGQWASNVGLRVLNGLSSLCQGLLWETTVLYAKCAQTEKLNSSAAAFSAADNSVIKTSASTSASTEVQAMEVSDSADAVCKNRLSPEQAIKLSKQLLSCTSKLDKTLNELFMLLVKHCVGSPLRQRRGQNLPPPPTTPTQSGRSVAEALGHLQHSLLLSAVDREIAEVSPNNPKGLLTDLLVQQMDRTDRNCALHPIKLQSFYLVCTLRTLSSILFDEKKLPYHLMMHHFFTSHGLTVFFKTFDWALEKVEEYSNDLLKSEGVHEALMEYLEQWCGLLERFVNPKNMLESPHILPSKSFSTSFINFNALQFLVHIQKVAFDSVLKIWNKSSENSITLTIKEMVLSILCSLLKAEQIIQDKLSKEKQTTVTASPALVSTVVRVPAPSPMSTLNWIEDSRRPADISSSQSAAPPPPTVNDAASASGVAPSEETNATEGSSEAASDGAAIATLASVTSGADEEEAAVPEPLLVANELQNDMDDVDVNQVWLQALMDMGFPEQRCLEAIAQANTMEQATEFLLNYNPPSEHLGLRMLSGLSGEGGDMELSEDVQMMQAIAMSLAAEETAVSEPVNPPVAGPIDATVSSSAGNSPAVTGSRTTSTASAPSTSKLIRQSLARPPPPKMTDQSLDKTCLDEFTDNVLEGCLRQIDSQPQLVYRVCELLTTCSKRNGSDWLGKMLNTLLEEVGSSCATQIQAAERVSCSDTLNQLRSSQGSLKFASRMHLLTLLLEDVRHSCIELINCADLVANLTTLLSATEAAMRRYGGLDSKASSGNFVASRELKSNEEKPTISDAQKEAEKPSHVNLCPKWVTSSILFIDLYEKVFLASKKRMEFFRNKRRIWKSYDSNLPKWTPYPYSINKTIDDAYFAGESTVRIVNASRRKYLIQFSSLVQINEESGNRRPIMMTWEDDAPSKISKNSVSALQTEHDIPTGFLSRVAQMASMSRTESPMEVQSGGYTESVAALPSSGDSAVQTPPPDSMEVEDASATECVKPKTEEDLAKLFDCSGEMLPIEISSDLMKICVGLLDLRVEPDAIHAILRLSTRLTRTWPGAMQFERLGGIKSLLKLDDSSQFAGFTNLAVLLMRHVLEEPHTLSAAMEKAIRGSLNSSSPSGSGREFNYMMRLLAPVSCRDHATFYRLSCNMLRVEHHRRPIAQQLNSEETILCQLATTNKTVTKAPEGPSMEAQNVIRDLLDAITHPIDEATQAAETAPKAVAMPSDSSMGQSNSSRRQLNLSRSSSVHDADDLSPLEGETVSSESFSKPKSETVNKVLSPLLTKWTICRLLAEFVKCYPDVAKLITEHVYSPDTVPNVSHECSAISYMLDSLVCGPPVIIPCASNQTEDGRNYVKVLIGALASCNHAPEAQNILVTEVKNSLARCCQLPESLSKHEQLQSLVSLITVMMESCPPHCPNPNIVFNNKAPVAMNNIMKILVRKGLITDLARITNSLDLSSPHLANTVNIALKALEMVARVINHPALLPTANVRKKMNSSESPATGDAATSTSNEGGADSIHNAQPTESETAAEDAAMSEEAGGSSACAPSGEATPQERRHDVSLESRHQNESHMNYDDFDEDLVEDGASLTPRRTENSLEAILSNLIGHSADTRNDGEEGGRGRRDSTVTTFALVIDQPMDTDETLHDSRMMTHSESRFLEDVDNLEEDEEGNDDDDGSSSSSSSSSSDSSSSDDEDHDEEGEDHEDHEGHDEENNAQGEFGVEEVEEDEEIEDGSVLDEDDEEEEEEDEVAIFDDSYLRLPLDRDADGMVLLPTYQHYLDTIQTIDTMIFGNRLSMHNHGFSDEHNIYGFTGPIISSGANDNNSTAIPPHPLFLNPRDGPQGGGSSGTTPAGGAGAGATGGGTAGRAAAGRNSRSRSVLRLMGRNASDVLDLSTNLMDSTQLWFTNDDVRITQINADGIVGPSSTLLYNGLRSADINSSLARWAEEARLLHADYIHDTIIRVREPLLSVLDARRITEQSERRAAEQIDRERKKKDQEAAIGPVIESRLSVLAAESEPAPPPAAGSSQPEDTISEEPRELTTAERTPEITIVSPLVLVENSAPEQQPELVPAFEEMQSEQLVPVILETLPLQSAEILPEVPPLPALLSNSEDVATLPDFEPLFIPYGLDSDLSVEGGVAELPRAGTPLQEAMAVDDVTEAGNSSGPRDVSEQHNEANLSMVVAETGLNASGALNNCDLADTMASVDSAAAAVGEEIQQVTAEASSPTAGTSDIAAVSMPTTEGSAATPLASSASSGMIHARDTEYADILGDIEIPEGVDPSFLAALPEDMRQEVIQEHMRLQRLRNRTQEPSTPSDTIAAAHIPTGEVSPEFLAALPPSIQEEVLMQQRAAQAAAARSNPDEPVDAAQFIAGLPPSLRQTILTDLDNSQYSALPPDLAQEAQTLRRQREERVRHAHDHLFQGSGSRGHTLSHILRNTARLGSRLMQSSHWPTSWNLQPSSSSSSTQPGLVQSKCKGRQMLDHEALSCLLVLLFLDEPKLNTSRLHRVLRYLCNHSPTRQWVVSTLLSMMEKCRDALPEVPPPIVAGSAMDCSTPDPSKGAIRKSSRPAMPGAMTPNSKVTQTPSWLNMSIDAALGCRANIFQISRPLSSGKKSATAAQSISVSVHPQAAPLVCKHALDAMIPLAKSFTIHFLPFRKKPEEASTSKSESKAVSDDGGASSSLNKNSVGKQPEATDFWELLVKLDSANISKKGKALARLHSNAGQCQSEEEQSCSTLEYSPLGLILEQLAHPVVRRSAMLTDKLLRLLALVSSGLSATNHLKLSVGKFIYTPDNLEAMERLFGLATQVLTSKSCSEEGLEDVTSILVNLSQCPPPARTLVLRLLLRGAATLGATVAVHINALLDDLKQHGQKIAEYQPDTSSKGVLRDRFTKKEVVIVGQAGTRHKPSGGELQLASMSALTSKTSSQAFFLRTLKVIVQLRDVAAARKSAKKSSPRETSAPAITEGTSHTSAVAPEGDAAADSTAVQGEASTAEQSISNTEETPQREQEVEPLLDGSIEQMDVSGLSQAENIASEQDSNANVADSEEPTDSSRADVDHVEPSEVVMSAAADGATSAQQSSHSNVIDVSETPATALADAEGDDNNDDNSDDEEEIQSLSSSLSLDELWEALSRCLDELAESPDAHAVLVLQPAVEAFFLVHATTPTGGSGSNRSRAAQPETRESQLAHLNELAPMSPRPAKLDESITSNDDVADETIALTDAQKFLKFAERHRSVLNQILRQSTVHLSDGPFSVLVDHIRLLDFDIKRKFFRTELERADDGMRREDLTVHVRRDHVFEDSFRELHRRSADEWKNRFYIVYEGEEGQDAGGLLREWYMIISREIFNPMYALFCISPGDRVTYMINSASHCNSNHLSYFKFVGRVIAKAIYDNKLLECYFTRSFYKHILGKMVHYTDMESEDYTFYQGLVYLMEHDVSTLGYELTFSTEVQEFGVTEVRELKPGGEKIAVTEDNKMEYIKLVCQMKMTGAIRKQLNSFLEGFYDIIPKRLISIFNEQELELLISGLPNIDIDDLRANTEYTKYQPNSLQIQWFWRALRTFDQAERAKFLQFVTGTSKVPLQGFGALEGMNGTQKFQIHRDDRSTDRLPSAHTCFNQLDLPVYETYDKLRHYLLKAVHECSEGFGFA